jgi:hypothetical protein
MVRFLALMTAADLLIMSIPATLLDKVHGTQWLAGIAVLLLLLPGFVSWNAGKLQNTRKPQPQTGGESAGPNRIREAPFEGLPIPIGPLGLVEAAWLRVWDAIVSNPASLRDAGLWTAVYDALSEARASSSRTRLHHVCDLLEETVVEVRPFLGGDPADHPGMVHEVMRAYKTLRRLIDDVRGGRA